MNKQKRLTAGIICGAVFLLIYSFVSFASECKEIRNDTLRLHILANSDSDGDQNVKLKVRDAVLAEATGIFDGSVSTENAKNELEPKLEIIEKTANETLKENGFDYYAKAEIVYEYFDTRCYDGNVTLPAGKYTALKITLGKGEGANWWCVMYPALCLPAAEEKCEKQAENIYSEKEQSIIYGNKKYEIRFKFVEYFEKIKNLFDDGDI